MRYDIWPNHIKALRDARIPIFLVDATMKDKSPRKLFFIKQFHENLFQSITKILTVSDTDKNGFKEFGCTERQLKTVGDTRFDRVYFRSLKAKESRLIKEDLLVNKRILVAGSTWESDEEILFPVFNKLTSKDDNIILIIAPHEPTLLHIENIESELKSLGTIRFSHLNNYKNQKVIIVDSIGILLMLYSYADIAFVGGGFKYNVHNVLEAAVYGVPVLFGPRFENSREAKELIKSGGGIVVKNKKDAYRNLRQLFTRHNLRKATGDISFKYVQENLGATDKIITEIYKVI
jgi:3-deoxy-D-manno-octulosonic-acid transferase